MSDHVTRASRDAMRQGERRLLWAFYGESPELEQTIGCQRHQNEGLLAEG